MPGGDRTGPRGAGPMTGRAAGYCAGFEGPGSMNPGVGRGGGFGAGRGFGFGRGWGRGLGRGRGAGGAWGWRWRAFPSSAFPSESAPAPQTDANSLAEVLERMRTELADMRARIEQLESIGTRGKGES